MQCAGDPGLSPTTSNWLSAVNFCHCTRKVPPASRAINGVGQTTARKPARRSVSPPCSNADRTISR